HREDVEPVRSRVVSDQRAVPGDGIEVEHVGVRRDRALLMQGDGRLDEADVPGDETVQHDNLRPSRRSRATAPGSAQNTVVHHGARLVRSIRSSRSTAPGEWPVTIPARSSRVTRSPPRYTDPSASAGSVTSGSASMVV